MAGRWFNTMGRAEVLELLDWVLAGAGGALLVVAELGRRRKRRDPLRPARARPNRLDPASVVFVFAAWLLVSALMRVPADLLFGLEAHPRSQELSATVAIGLAGLVMIPVCLVVAARRFRAGLRGWGIGRRPFAVSALWGAAGFLASWPICWGLLKFSSGVLRAVWPEYELQVHRVMQVLHWPGVPAATIVWLYVSAIVITPLFEEMFFRGLLQSMLVRLVRQRWGGMVLASAVFGLVHAGQVQAVLPMVAFGLCLGFVYEKSGSLTAAILVHGLFNAKNLLWDALVNA